MKIPLRLQPRLTHEPAEALLLPSTHACDLFALIEALGLESLPAVFATAEGFLVLLPAAQTVPVTGVVRLRRLANHLYLPTDADLVHPLLPDEAQGLVRNRGLIFLPGQRVLEFAPQKPLGWQALVAAPKCTAPAWRALPEAPELAEDLHELTMPTPLPGADEIIEQGRAEIGTEAPQPGGAAGAGAKAAGAALFFLGKSLAWLGTKLNLAPLAGAGANLLERGMQLTPKLSEWLMNRQEALLRHLLKDFQDGNIEKALRHALPLSNSAPGSIAGNAELPTHDLLYSLRNLLGGRGPAGPAWLTPHQLFYALQAEYRKQAERAIERGDYRRAAFIYAKLLNDMGASAQVLSRGGLHRDAAVLYEKTLNNPRAAAGEWALAGEIEKAVAIFIRLDDVLAAADLLAQAGEAERALTLYRQAAGKLAGQGKYLEAGDLLRTRGQRVDLAIEMYSQGWSDRGLVTSIPCGLALAQFYAREPNAARFMTLLAEGEEWHEPWGPESTAHFFNQMAQLAQAAPLAGIADAAMDTCLMVLAQTLKNNGREIGRTGAPGEYFLPHAPWPAPLVRDARFALHSVPAKRTAPLQFASARLGDSTVRAVCHMPHSGELFLGFENGEIIRHWPISGKSTTVIKSPLAVCGLVSPVTEHFLAALATSPGAAHVYLGSSTTDFQLKEFIVMDSPTPARLCTPAGQTPYFALLQEEQVIIGNFNTANRHAIVPIPGMVPRAGIIGDLPGMDGVPWLLLFYDDAARFILHDRVHFSIDIDAPPENPPRNTLAQPPLQTWREHEHLFNICWLTREGRIHTVDLDFSRFAELHDDPPLARHVPTKKPVPGIFGCRIHHAREEAIESLWDRLDDRLDTRGALLSNPVALFPLTHKKLLVVNADGSLLRI
jgi:tetratricopeptide (TPR) repeat protein